LLNGLQYRQDWAEINELKAAKFASEGS
jgi:hypothetical protein